MAKFEPLHKGPIFPLALMAIFAVMVPLYSMTANRKTFTESNAMRLTVPTNEPRYLGPTDSYPTMSPTPKVSPTPAGKMMPKSRY